MSLEDKRIELDALSPGCIAVSVYTENEDTIYILSFYYPNMNISRVITSHVNETDAIAKLQEYIDYLTGGGAAPYVPQAVTARQMVLALAMSGISEDTIMAMINSLSEPTKTAAKITWSRSYEFHRNNPLLVALAPALSLNSSQVDDLFRLAITL